MYIILFTVYLYRVDMDSANSFLSCSGMYV